MATKKVTYVEPAGYFSPEMLKAVNNASKKAPAAKKPASTGKKPASTGKKK